MRVSLARRSTAAVATCLLLLGGALAGCGDDSSSSSDSSSASDSSAAEDSTPAGDESTPAGDESTASGDESTPADDESTAGAGGSADAAEFCTALSKLDDIDDNASTKDQINAAKDAVDELASVDVPSDMPADAQKGYATLITKVKELDENASEADVEKLFSDSEADVIAFFTYVTTACPDFAS